MIASQPLQGLESHMTYSQGHPIKLVGGRLALDFVNTADWSAEAQVVHEKIASEADLKLWLDALQLNKIVIAEKIPQLLTFRFELRQLLLGAGHTSILDAAQGVKFEPNARPNSTLTRQPLTTILAISAFAILADRREIDRLKMCPGERCGWLFIDETKNARRRWCSMDSCGNRAKAARHYARTRA